MKLKTLLVTAVCLAPASAFAQDSKVEVSAWGGYTFSEGVPIQEIEIDGERFNEVNPTSGASYGFAFGVFVTENISVEFAVDQQRSNLEGKGFGNRREFVSMNLNNYHGNFVYNWGDDRDEMRPFIFGGIGATSFSPSNVEGVDVEGNTRFSSNWGGGVKFYPSSHFGLKVMARWVPTYIKSEPGGIWCSPFWPWGCYQLVDNQYVNQFQFAGGVTLRF